MLHFPKFSQINTSEALKAYANAYSRCSGFNVNRDYYETNQVFGVWWQGTLIGGFVLGSGDHLRTVEVFVGEESRESLYRTIQQNAVTEICCFYIEPEFRNRFWLNLTVWFYIAYALYMCGTPTLVFGTNSVRLAALYSATPKCKTLHLDFLNRKQTFVFTGKRGDCLVGVGQIVWYKIKRVANMAWRKRSTRLSMALSF